MMKILVPAAFAATTLLVAGCASKSDAELQQEAMQMLKTSFREQGIAKMDRIEQDLGQKACSSPTPPSEAVARQIEAEALKSIQWPRDGKFIGDWKNGEKLAQSGRGMTWTDKSASTAGNGGQCYNCHQIDNKEISFGTIGPSLHNYGKNRGVKNVNDAAAQPVLKYTWGKLWNSKAYAACSNMPRFGHSKLLDEQQLRDVMALLLDPNSPVNK
jgi:sulfur-oxidizing protein SoxX